MELRDKGYVNPMKQLSEDSLRGDGATKNAAPAISFGGYSILGLEILLSPTPCRLDHH